jgi:hypothetical protein
MKPLNGWQRLWVLLAVLWLVPVLTVSYFVWPTAPGAFVRSPERHYEIKDTLNERPLNVTAPHALTFTELQRAWLDALVVPASVSEVVEIPGLGDVRFPIDVFRPEFRALSIAQINVTAEKLNHARDIEITDAAVRLHQDHVRAVKDRQRSIVVKAIAGWLVPAVALYALGAAIAWVRRGFASPRI